MSHIWGRESGLKCGPVRTAVPPRDAKIAVLWAISKILAGAPQSQGSLPGPVRLGSEPPDTRSGAGLPGLTAGARRLEVGGEGSGAVRRWKTPTTSRCWSGFASPAESGASYRIGLFPRRTRSPSAAHDAPVPSQRNTDPYSKDRRRRERRTGTCSSRGPKFSTRRSNV